MEEAIIGQLKKKGLRGDTFGVESEITSVKFVANTSHGIETKLGKGLGLRIVKDGRIGFSSTTNYDKRDELVDTAIATSRFGDEARFELPQPTDFPRPKTSDPRVQNLTTETMVETGEEIIDRFLEKEPEAKFDVQLTKSTGRVRLYNTEGNDARYENAGYYVGVEGLLIIDSSLVWVYDYVNLSSGAPLAIDDLIQRNSELLRQARRKAHLESKNYPALLMPLAAIDFLQALMPGVNGKLFQKGISPLIGKENQPILDSKLTIYDDGLRDFGEGSAPFDGDGLPQRRTPVIENGVFRNFLFDLQTGGSVGRPSTGNGQRSYGSLPSPGFNNLVVQPGKSQFKDALAGLGEGVVVYSAVGGGQSNLLAGDFSLNVSLGYKIENGAVTGRIKDVMVAGNFYDAGKELEDVGAVTTDLGNFYLPFFWFKSLSFAAKD
jgi:PmbA protein